MNKENTSTKESQQECKNCKELENKLIILSQQNKTLEQELQECKQHNLYNQAEIENYKKHIDRQLALAVEHSNEKLLKEILNIVDDLERAITTIKNNDDLKGITLVYNNLMKLLSEYNIKKIDCLGKQLDVNYCEALLQEECDKKDCTILEELQKGYLYKNKVLRFAKVKVAKNIQNNIDKN